MMTATSNFFYGSMLPLQNCNTRLCCWDDFCVPHSSGHRTLIVSTACACSSGRTRSVSRRRFSSSRSKFSQVRRLRKVARNMRGFDLSGTAASRHGLAKLRVPKYPPWWRDRSWFTYSRRMIVGSSGNYRIVHIYIKRPLKSP